MRLTNTITLRVHNKELSEHAQFKERLRTQYGERVDFEENTLKPDVVPQTSFDKLYVLTAKLYYQPEQKAFIHDLRLFLENKQELLGEAQRHLDERHTFFFRIEKTSFYTNTWKFVPKGDVIQVRINMCAHPKTRENAMACVHALFT
jgi:hypothetical protein